MWGLVLAAVLALVTACAASREPPARPEGLSTAPEPGPRGTAVPERTGGRRQEAFPRSDRVAPGRSLTYYAGPGSPGGDATLTGAYIFDDAGGDGVELVVRHDGGARTLGLVCGSPPSDVELSGGSRGARPGDAPSYTLSIDCEADPETVSVENHTGAELVVLRVASVLGGVVVPGRGGGGSGRNGTVTVTLRLRLRGAVPPGQGFELAFAADGGSDAMPVTHGGDARVPFCGGHGFAGDVPPCTGGGTTYSREVRFERGTTLLWYSYNRVSYVPSPGARLGPFRGDSGIRLERDVTIGAEYAFPEDRDGAISSDGDGYRVCDADEVAPAIRIENARRRVVIATPLSARGARCFLATSIALTIRDDRGRAPGVTGNGVTYFVSTTVPTGGAAPLFVWSNWCGGRGPFAYEVALADETQIRVARLRTWSAPPCEARGGRSGLGAVGLEQAQGGMPDLPRRAVR